MSILTQSIGVFHLLMQITEQQLGWVLTTTGNALIVRTTDGGNTWVIQDAGLTQSVILFGVSFTDANTGTAVGQNGTITRTTNGGSSWITQTSGTQLTLMVFLSPMRTMVLQSADRWTPVRA